MIFNIGHVWESIIPLDSMAKQEDSELPSIYCKQVNFHVCADQFSATLFISDKQ